MNETPFQRYAKIIPKLKFYDGKICENCGQRNDRPLSKYCGPCAAYISEEKRKAFRAKYGYGKVVKSTVCATCGGYNDRPRSPNCKPCADKLSNEHRRNTRPSRSKKHEQGTETFD